MERENALAVMEAEREFQKLSYGRRGTLMMSAAGSAKNLSPLKRTSGTSLNELAGHGLMQKLKGSLGKLIIEKSGSDKSSSSPSPLPPSSAGKLPLTATKLGA